jgi:hypothetical protein
MPSSSAGGIAASGEPPAAMTPTNANCDAPVNITTLSSIVWPRLSPELTDTAPKVIPNAPAYRPIPTAVRMISRRSGALASTIYAILRL